MLTVFDTFKSVRLGGHNKVETITLIFSYSKSKINPIIVNPALIFTFV